MNHLYFLNPRCLLYYAQFISTALCSAPECLVSCLYYMAPTLSCDFSVSVQVCFQGLLSKPLSFSPLCSSFFPSGCHFLKSCISSTGVCAPSPWDAWSQLFAFSRWISHKTPPYFSSVDFTQSRLDWCMFCSLLSTGAAPPARSLFCVLHLPCSCLHFPSTLKGFHYLSLKSIVFIFSISSPKTFKFMFYQHIICLSLSFFPETLLGGWFPFTQCNGLGVICIDVSVCAIRLTLVLGAE